MESNVIKEHNGIRYKEQNPDTLNPFAFWFILIGEYAIKTKIVGFEYEDAYVKLTEDGLLVIKDGFGWEASSIAYDNEYTRRASLVHDALYWIADHGGFGEAYYVREIADKLLYRIFWQDTPWYLKWTGVGWFRARLWYRSVRIGGKSYWADGKDN